MKYDGNRSPDDIDVLVSSRVKAARREKGATIHELGEAIGVSHQQVNKIEKGVNRISAGRLYRAAVFLGRPVAFFFPSQSDGQK